MSLLDEVIKIQIIRDNLGITRIGFGTPLIIGTSLSTFPGTVKSYTNLTEVSIDFAPTTEEYLIASKLFAQSFKPAKILITQKLSQLTLLAAYTEAKTITEDFYAVISTSDVEADVLALAAAIETESRIYANSTQDVDVAFNNPNNIAAKLENLNYTRTFMFYHNMANTFKPDAAILGKMLPLDPGSVTWAYQNLVGVGTDDLSALERSNLRLNNVIYYAPLAGVDVTFDGKMVGGEYIDVIHGLDWLKVYIQENISSLLITAGKIPFNNQGIGLVENILRASLQEAVNRGIINQDFTVVTPDVTAVSAVNKAARTLPDVFFYATLTGAIQNINQITGTVTV